MRPEDTSVSLRRDLSAQAQEYDASAAAARFIGMQAAPVFPIPEAAGNFPIFRRSDMKKPAETSRAEGAGYNRLIGRFGTGSYTCQENGLEFPNDDRRAARYSLFFDSEVAGTRILRAQILLARERRIAALFADAGFTNHNATTAWSDATAVPINDILTGVETIEDNCGCSRSQMALIVPRAGFREMLATTQVIDKTKYTYPGVQPALLQPLQIASMLGIGKVLVASGVYDSAEEGADESNSQIWGSTIAHICVVADEGDDLEVPAVARTMQWMAQAPELPVVETYRDEALRSTVIRMREDTDEVLIGATDLFAYKLTY